MKGRRDTDRQAVDIYVVLCSCPNQKTAERLADGVLQQGLCRCVTIVPGLQSRFQWQEAFQSVSECLMLIKLSQAAYPGLESWLLKEHPYECPEIMALPVAEVARAYGHWVLCGDSSSETEAY